MGYYKTSEDYFRQFARQQVMIRHKEPASGADTTPRESFFRINDEEEFNAACIHWVHSPCMVMMAMSGRMIDKGGSLRQNNIHTLFIITKIELDPNDPVDAPAITEAYDITFAIMKELIAVMDEDFEDRCGAYFEPGDCGWEQVGPIGDGFYGWVLQFSDEKLANLSTDMTLNFQCMNQKEIIPVVNQSEVVIPWTTLRKNRFGLFPDVEVYLTNAENLSYRIDAEVLADLPPPDTTSITVKFAGPGNGFILIG